MRPLPPFFRWLTVAALADWLITRTLTRSAIFMPKSPPVIAVYQALTVIGQLAFTLTALVALIVIGWIAFHEWPREPRARRAFGIPIAWLSLLALNLVFLVIPPQGWLAVGHHLLVVAVVGMIGWRTWSGAGEIRKRIAWSLPALALVAGELYQLSQTLFEALRWPGPSPFATTIFNLGELFVVLSPVGLWWAYRRNVETRPGASLLLPATLPALAFTVAHLLNPALTAIIAIWSTGLTLYLPWPVYAVSLWLAGDVVVSLRRSAAPATGAMLLLAAGGYTPQLSTQVFLGLIALWLLALPFDARSVSAVPSSRGEAWPQLPSSNALPQTAVEAPKP